MVGHGDGLWMIPGASSGENAQALVKLLQDGGVDILDVVSIILPS